jgi:anti-sigma regulatory factor (Ser/Thr protein kinase)
MPRLPQLMAFVEDFCRQHAISKDDSLRLALITEELFSNTATHGLHGSGAGKVRISLEAEASQVTMTYEDSAPPFDPLAHLDAARAELELPVEDRRVGGFGLVLIARISDGVGYLRQGGWNRTRLVLRRET